MTRAIGESLRLAAFVLFFAPAVVLALARAFAPVVRDVPADLLVERFDKTGPLVAERALADFPPRVDVRAAVLVPARVFLLLLRDLEDFFARAAMTVSSRG